MIESGERLTATILKNVFAPNLIPQEIQSAASKHNDHLQELSDLRGREGLSLRAR
jgi:hypothetical protein